MHIKLKKKIENRNKTTILGMGSHSPSYKGVWQDYRLREVPLSLIVVNKYIKIKQCFPQLFQTPLMLLFSASSFFLSVHPHPQLQLNFPVLPISFFLTRWSYCSLLWSSFLPLPYSFYLSCFCGYARLFIHSYILSADV